VYYLIESIFTFLELRLLPDLILFIYVTVFSVVKVLGPVLIKTL